jgi:catechol 2,3-dioxygenase-like lactoylglutathione lyase family enzyme
MTVNALNHICFTVSDLQRAVVFWERLLGSAPESMTEYNDPQDEAVTGYPGVHISAAYFRLPGGALLELFQYREPPTVPAATSETYVVGNSHLGIVVDDLDETYRKLQGTGATFRSPGPVPIAAGEHTGARSMYVRDPDGITIEILDFPFTPASSAAQSHAGAERAK